MMHTIQFHNSLVYICHEGKKRNKVRKEKGHKKGKRPSALSCFPLFLHTIFRFYTLKKSFAFVAGTKVRQLEMATKKVTLTLR
jgi:hypothetical protein